MYSSSKPLLQADSATSGDPVVADPDVEGADVVNVYEWWFAPARAEVNLATTLLSTGGLLAFIYFVTPSIGQEQWYIYALLGVAWTSLVTIVEGLCIVLFGR